MQLAIVADHWDRSRGGGEQYLSDLACAIRQAGHPVDIYCRKSRDDPAGVNIHRIPYISYPRFLNEWSFARNVDRELRVSPQTPVLASRPTRAASHYFLPSGLYALAFEAEREALDSFWRRRLYRLGTRVNPKRQLMLRMQERLLGGKKRPQLMVHSHQLQKDLRQRYGIPADEVLVLPPGVNLNRFRSHATSSSAQWRQAVSAEPAELLLLFAAHNFVLKGLHSALAALSKGRDTRLKARLLVAGAGPISKFSRLARRLGVGSQVTFLGPVAQDALADLYRTSDALIHPTFYDPCSLVVLEALACGCPAITTRRNGASEYMQSGTHGIVIEDPRDAETLCQALLLVSDPAARQRMRQAATLLGDNFDLRTNAVKVVAWLESTRARERESGIGESAVRGAGVERDGREC